MSIFDLLTFSLNPLRRVGSGGAAAAQAAAAADSAQLLEGVMAVATKAAALQLRALAASALAPLVARADALLGATALLESFPECPAALQPRPNEVHRRVLSMFKTTTAACFYTSCSCQSYDLPRINLPCMAYLELTYLVCMTSPSLVGCSPLPQVHGLVLMALSLVTVAAPPALPAEAHIALTSTQVAQLPALAAVVQSRLLWTLSGPAPAAIKRDATRLLSALCRLPVVSPCDALQDLCLAVKQTCLECLLGCVGTSNKEVHSCTYMFFMYMTCCRLLSPQNQLVWVCNCTQRFGFFHMPLQCTGLVQWLLCLAALTSSIPCGTHGSSKPLCCGANYCSPKVCVGLLYVCVGLL